MTKREHQQHLDLDINPSFPVRKYASTSEIVIYLYKTAIAIMNIVLVAYYFEYFLWVCGHVS